MAKKCVLSHRIAVWALSMALTLFGAASAKADTILGFTGIFDPANWTLTALNGGSVITTDAPDSITLIGPNSGVAGDADFTIQLAIPAPGMWWSFNWDYFTNDPTVGFDAGEYLQNGFDTLLAQNDGEPPTHFSGSSGPISIFDGDSIGFRVHSSDGLLGAGTLTISNFFIYDTPEPSTWALFGLGTAALVALRRRAKQG